MLSPDFLERVHSLNIMPTKGLCLVALDYTTRYVTSSHAYLTSSHALIKKVSCLRYNSVKS